MSRKCMPVRSSLGSFSWCSRGTFIQYDRNQDVCLRLEDMLEIPDFHDPSRKLGRGLHCR